MGSVYPQSFGARPGSCICEVPQPLESNVWTGRGPSEYPFMTCIPAAHQVTWALVPWLLKPGPCHLDQSLGWAWGSEFFKGSITEVSVIGAETRTVVVRGREGASGVMLVRVQIFSYKSSEFHSSTIQLQAQVNDMELYP